MDAQQPCSVVSPKSSLSQLLTALQGALNDEDDEDEDDEHDLMTLI